MKKNMLFLITISLEVVLINFLLFGKEAANYIIFFQGFIFLGFLLSINKYFSVFVLFLELLIFSILFAYHSYFNSPINLLIINNQYKEGFDIITKNYSMLLNQTFFIFLISFLLKSFYIIKFYKPIKLTYFFIIPILIFLFLTHQTFHKQVFFINNYNNYASTFGYLYAFTYQTASKLNVKNLEKRILNNKNKKINLDYKLSKTKNIYIIQIESLDYAGITSKHMPFLNSLKKKSIFYKIIPHIHRVSANTDFSILTSSYEYNSIHSVLYKEINEKIYQQVKTLPQRAKKQGLTSAFYHGYKQDFFNRYKHISQMGFNKVFFEETLPKHFIKTEWGVQDKDLFKFVLSQNYNFNFIITVTSHTPFDIGKIHLNPYKKAKTQKELYLNSLNYVDEGLKYLVQNSPQDSLFIMYSDHQSEVLENTSTVLIVYDKQNPKALQKELDFKDLPNIIKTILENNANQ